MNETIYGALCFIPVSCVIIIAIITRRTIEPLLCGAMIGWIIIAGEDFLWHTVESSVRTAADPDTMWIIVVCGMFGSIIAILTKSGGAMAFGEALSKKVKSERSSLVTAWFMGVIIFVDDYLSCLVVGPTMRKITDKLVVPRAALAYMVSSTAAPICLLVPVSTWAVYLTVLMEKNDLAPSGGGMKLFISTIPFNFYPIIALLLTLFFALKWIPPLGPMKTSYKIAKETGDVLSGIPILIVKEPKVNEGVKTSVWDFFIPMIVLLVVTIYYDVDLLRGAFATVITCILLYVPRKKMTIKEALDTMIEGSTTMLSPLLVVVAGFMLLEVNDTLGLTPYIIDMCAPYLNGIWFCSIVFLVQASIGFFTGSNWGTWDIMMPIVMPLAAVTGVPQVLALGALFSGGGFGSHACPWGDATVLASAGTAMDNLDHVKTQLPYSIIGAVSTFFAFAIASFFML